MPKYDDEGDRMIENRQLLEVSLSWSLQEIMSHLLPISIFQISRTELFFNPVHRPFASILFAAQFVAIGLFANGFLDSEIVIII